MSPPFLHSGKRRLVHRSELESVLDEVDQALLIRNAHYNRQNSGLVLADVLNFRFKVTEFNPLGRGYQELPGFLSRKRAIINVKNDDERCFGYAVLAALESNDDHNSKRASRYNRLFHQYQLDTITNPVEIADIPNHEDMLQVNINVISFYDDEGKARYPLYVSKKKFAKSIDLLYWDEHYAWIKSFSSFMADLSKNNTLHWCRACLGHFDNERSFATHQLYCQGIDDCGQIFVLPNANRKVRFENQPYVVSINF